MGNCLNLPKSSSYNAIKDEDAPAPTRIAIEVTGRVCWDIYIGEYCNDLIPISLKNDLILQSQSLVSDKKKLNYRNLSIANNEHNHIQIQDLIDPHNISTISNVFNTKNTKNIANENIHSWIPTVFNLNKHTKSYDIISEINDLPKCSYPKLYQTIQNIFNKMIPNINRSLNVYPFEITEYEQQAIAYRKTNICYTEKIIKCKEKKTNLYNKLYVIIKMSDYQFMNDTTSFYNHIHFDSEGFDKEYIKCVALYYFDVTPNINGNLSVQDTTHRSWYHTKNANINVVDNQCIFFTNEKPYKHKIDKMQMNNRIKMSVHNKNKENEEIYGTTKVLSFCIVDPRKQIYVNSSQDIIVNFPQKISLIVNCWFKLANVKNYNNNKFIIINIGVMDIIKSFICGNMKYIKNKTDQYRKQRYRFNQEMREYQCKIVHKERSL